MAGAGRPKAPLTLSADERAVLERWARRPKSAQALALRSKIVLACAEGTANKEVAARLGVTPQMVGKWRARFVAARLDGLADEPRPGQPRKITDEQVEEVIVKTLEQATESGYALVDPVDGEGDGPEPDRCLTDLAGVRPEAAGAGNMEALL